MTYTPGPWHIGAHDRVDTIFGPEGTRRAPSHLWPVARVLAGPDKDEDAANARLIAAAPELLEVSTKLAEFAELALADMSDQDTGWYYQLRRAAQIARAAIAKATT